MTYVLVGSKSGHSGKEEDEEAEVKEVCGQGAGLGGDKHFRKSQKTQRA